MTTPIGMGDISQAVNNTSLDLGTLVGKGNIKKWALHKPVRLLDGVDTPADLYPDNTTWVAHMNNDVREIASNTKCPFALKVTPSNNLYKVVGLTADASIDWVYQQPPVEGTFWRRMLDFKGYTNTPNVPMNKMMDFTYYKTGATNVLSIDTNDGEAGDTSIQVAQLTGTLGNYRIMLAIRNGTTNWRYCVMSDIITNSISAGTIDFTLPSGLDLSNGSYNAYVVGVDKTWDGSANTWIQGYNSYMQTFSHNLLPLPFASKEESKFTFKVSGTDASNIIFISYRFRMKRDGTIQSIDFYGSKNGSIAGSSYKVTLSNFTIRDDNDQTLGTVSGNAVLSGWQSADGKSTASVTKNIASYGIKDTSSSPYPNLLFTMTQSGGSYTLNDAGIEGEPIFVD